MNTRHAIELRKCYKSPQYFIDTYCRILDATSGEWVDFKLWPEQKQTLRAIHEYDEHVILKARQVGLSWLVLCYALWQMIFQPIASIIVFSKRENEAMYLLDKRMKGVFKHLPAFLTSGIEFLEDNKSLWELNNGSIAQAQSSGGGDSYQGSLVMCDEFDLIREQDRLLASIKPTIDAGGKLILISRADKSTPNSSFKKIYRGAIEGKNNYHATFLPWYVRPERTAEWYEAKKADIMQRTGSLDELHEQYPATDLEALNPRTLDKRIPAEFLMNCYKAIEPALPDDMPAIPHLTIYEPPIAGESYVIGADPAEGNPTSDPSAATVMKSRTGEGVARIKGQIQVAPFASYVDKLGVYYNYAGIMPERDNHGHAVILWLQENGQCPILTGYDDKPGWLNNAKGKTLLYTEMATAAQEQSVTIYDRETYTQLAGIDASTLLAPKGEHDDLADSYALANVAQAQMISSVFLFE